MNMIVIGCGRVGSDLAYRLFKQGHKVCVIDQDEKAFSNLPGDFRGRTVEGEALNQSVLHRASIETADGLAVVTNSDTINAVVAHVAQATYHTRRVVLARNYDPRYRSLYEAFNIQVISSATWGAQRIEELLYGQEIRHGLLGWQWRDRVIRVQHPCGLEWKETGRVTPGSRLLPHGPDAHRPGNQFYFKSFSEITG